MSSSSSECEDDDYWQKTDFGYNVNIRNAFGRNPFYPTMGHPLVYYAEVQQPRKRDGRERQRGNPNCFVKAFRWYTKEHVPTRSASPNHLKITGFAAWLDTKYDEFLQESLMDSEMLHLKAKHTSVLEAERISKNSCCDPRVRKGFAARCPWTKKRRTKSNETRKSRQKSNQSFQYIMQPKEASRPTSECENFSSVALMVSECSNKCIAKSHSVSNITNLVVQSINQQVTTPVERIVKTKESLYKYNISTTFGDKNSINGKVEGPTQKMNACHDFGCQFCEERALKVNVETQYVLSDSASNTGRSVPLCLRESPDLCACPVPKLVGQKSLNNVAHNGNWNQSKTIKCDCGTLDKMERNLTSKVSVAIAKDPRRNKVTINHKNVDCQYPEERIVKIDAQTQYEDTNLKCTIHNINCGCDFKGVMRSYLHPVQSTSILSNQCEIKVNENLPTEKPTVQFSQSTAQTSNHAICLGDKKVYGYPLFLKVICADKLE